MPAIIGSENVTAIVVPADLCSGCGVCAGVCPANCLQMQMLGGKYRPVLVGECLPRCNLCLNACPFADHELLRDDIAESLLGEQHDLKYDPAMGYFLQAFVGHSLMANHRERGASGGMATWLLEQLLVTGEVDRVVSVGSVRAPNHPLFQYQVCQGVDQVRSSAGSKYYPAEISAVLKSILHGPKDHRYAVVGLPCVVQGIRRAALKRPRLKKRVRFLFGLVCGHCPGTYYTEFLCALTGVSRSDVRTVEYRVKGVRRANDFGFRAQATHGTWTHPVWFQGWPSRVWGQQHFAYNACCYCDDVFAEMADAVFMDAWLENFMSETRGTSIVVVRNGQLRALMEDGVRMGSCHLAPCSIDDVIASQKNRVHRKKETIRYRMLARLDRGDWLPRMQIQPATDASQAELRVANRQVGIVQGSDRLWPIFRGLPRRWLPIYCWVVDRLLGTVYALKGVKLGTVVIGAVKRIGLYSALNTLRKRGASLRQGLLSLDTPYFRRLSMKYARALGQRRGRPRSRQDGLSALILPPSHEGSLGDEAVVTSFVASLAARGVRRIGLLQYGPKDRWKKVPAGVVRISLQGYFRQGGLRQRVRFIRAAYRYHRFYVLGTDVLDGYYSEQRSLRRIGLAELAAETGAQTTIVGFSFNRKPKATCVEAMRDLPSQVQLCCRDPFSLARVERLTGRPARLVADVAFLLEPLTGTEPVSLTAKWIRAQHLDSRVVVGINANSLIVRHAALAGPDELIRIYSRGLAKVFSRRGNLSYLLIPHDFRGAVSESFIMAAIRDALPAEVRNHSLVPPTPFSAAEAKAMCTELDLVFTGRMHLAIAALGQGVPACCVSYQDKMDGLFRHFDLDGMTIPQEQIAQPEVWAEFLIGMIDRRSEIREHIRKRLPGIRKLAQANIHFVR